MPERTPAGATVEYVPNPEPFECGQYNRHPIMFLGFYRVVLDDGFTFLSPHAATPGTVGAMPVDLGANPEFVSFLIGQAERVRDYTPDIVEPEVTTLITGDMVRKAKAAMAMRVPTDSDVRAALQAVEGDIIEAFGASGHGA